MWTVLSTLFMLLLPLMPEDQVLCSLGSGGTKYNAYSDVGPTPDAMELAVLVNGALRSMCQPNCPTIAMFRNASAPNVMLVVTGERAKIIYEPGFFTTVYETYGDGEILAILAHEVGHAIDTHRAPQWMKTSWSPELRADAWAGCALARMNLSVRPLQAGLTALSKYPSPAHPDWLTRIPILKAGYMQCGGDVSRFEPGRH
jgi:hypothetical protein